MPPRFKVAAIPSEDVPVPAGAEFLRAGRLELESACDSDEGPMVLIEHDVVLQSPANMVGADQIVAVSFDEGVSWWPLGGSGQSERGATDDGGEFINIEAAASDLDQLASGFLTSMECQQHFVGFGLRQTSASNLIDSLNSSLDQRRDAEPERDDDDWTDDPGEMAPPE